MEDERSPAVQRAIRHFWLLYYTLHPDRLRAKLDEPIAIPRPSDLES
jgi:hypothetical protein